MFLTNLLMTQVTQILVVDDFALWRRRIQAMIESEKNLKIIAVATNGLEAVQKAEELQPDLILLDIGLPALNGMEAARRIRKISPNSKILFFSQESSADMVEEALRLGADGYLLKSDAASEFLLAVCAVLQGKRFVSSRLRGNVFRNTADELPMQLQMTETGRVHVVASYRDDGSFIDDFTRFVEAALTAGNPVIVIATEAHRSALLRQLHTRGWDIAAILQDGSYISLDACDVLSTFMVDDWPDPVRLLNVADDLIGKAAKAGKGAHSKVAVCGECAPTLWAQGKAEAAIEVERLWDDVARRYAIDLLCGYLLSDSQNGGHDAMFQRICAEHSAAYSL